MYGRITITEVLDEGRNWKKNVGLSKQINGQTLEDEP